MATIASGKVVEIGDGGNLVTDIDLAKVAAAVGNEETKVEFGGHETVGLFEENHGQPEGTMVASVGASGAVEIEIVGMSLGSMLGIGVNTEVKVQW
ncbi:adenosylmethionine-8-amino-7-oxononanoate aminotransferase [Mariniblastus sp.]|nr:adenosylmethionine-8-amino-7-oxononanoate aminotransferase [Mariniblastus sp.]